MPNYQNGKIYKITGTNNENKELIYIGSTVQKLCKRFSTHKRDKDCASIIVLNCLNCKITLIENYMCNSREELVSRERYFYDFYDCVNKRRPMLFDGEKERNRHDYYLNNIETFREYRLNTAEERKTYDKQYYITNKEYLVNQRFERYSLNKNELNNKKREQYYEDEEYKNKRIIQSQQYREKNRIEINRKQLEKYHQTKEQKLMGLEDICV